MTRGTAALLAALLVVGTTSPAQAGGEQALTGPVSGLASSATTSSLTFSWNQARSRTWQKVDYVVKVSTNSAMDGAIRGGVKTVRGHAGPRPARERASFTITSPMRHGVGQRYWVSVYTRTVGNRFTRLDPQTARNRYSTSLVPAEPSADSLDVVPSCKGLTARWAPGQQPANARGVMVEVRRASGGVLGTPVYYSGYEPSESTSVSDLASDTEYQVRIKPTAVGRTSAGWSEPRSVRTRTCAAKPVRVATYNVLVDSAGADWSTRGPLVAAQIEANADVVTLQEARYGTKQLARLVTWLGPGWAQADTTIRSGVHMLYRRSAVRPYGSPRWSDGQTKAYTLAQAFTPTSGWAPFAVVDLHVDARADDAERARQVDRALEISRNMNRIGADAPVVVAGDLNLARGTDRNTVERQHLGIQGTNAEHWRPGRSADGRWTPARPLDPYSSRNALQRCPPRAGIKVDAIVATGPASVTAWWMPKPRLSARTGCFTGTIASDHFLVAAKVWIPVPTD